MVSDTIMEYSIPAQWVSTKDHKVYTGWLVKAKDIGWFRSTDSKWATKSEVMEIPVSKN